MKKILITLAIVLICAGTSFAEFGTTVTVGSGGTAQTVDMSKNVQAQYTGADSQTFSAAAYNSGGRRVFGVTSESTTVRFATCTDELCDADGFSAVTVGTDGDSADFRGEGWDDL